MTTGESRGARLAPRDCERGWVLLVSGWVCVSHLARLPPSLSLSLSFLCLCLGESRRTFSEPLSLSLSPPPSSLRQA